MKGPDKPKWTRDMPNEIGRLFQGIIYIEGKDTSFFVHSHKVPQDIKVTYSRILCNIRPQKKETHRLQLTVDSEKLTYDVPVFNPTAYLTMSKIHCNSVLSTPDAKYIILDVKNLYLNNIMKKGEYYKISIKLIYQEIIDKYDLDNKQIYGYIYVRVEK